MPWRAARPERGCTKPGVARRESRPRARWRRPPARPGASTTSLAGREVEARVALVGLVAGARASGAQSADGDVDHRDRRLAARALLGDEVAREPAQPRAAAAARARARPPRCLAAPRSARRARRAPRARSRPRTARAAARPRSGPRTARRSAPRARRDPRRSAPRSGVRRGNACASRRRASGSSAVDLVQDELDGNVVGADLGEHRARRRRSSRASRSSDSEASATCRTRSATSVSSSVAAKPFDELRRQPADEADGVGHEVALAVVLERRASSGRASRRGGRRRTRRRR